METWNSNSLTVQNLILLMSRIPKCHLEFRLTRLSRKNTEKSECLSWIFYKKAELLPGTAPIFANKIFVKILTKTSILLQYCTEDDMVRRNLQRSKFCQIWLILRTFHPFSAQLLIFCHRGGWGPNFLKYSPVINVRILSKVDIWLDLMMDIPELIFKTDSFWLNL